MSLSEGPKPPSNFHLHPSFLPITLSCHIQYTTLLFPCSVSISCFLPNIVDISLAAVCSVLSFQLIVQSCSFSPPCLQTLPLFRTVSRVLCSWCSGLSGALSFNSHNPNAAMRRYSLERTRLWESHSLGSSKVCIWTDEHTFLCWHSHSGIREAW